jgi:hypothetical protein
MSGARLTATDPPPALDGDGNLGFEELDVDHH